MYAQGISSNFVRHEPCPKCKSKDNLGRWSDGHAFCFGCNYYEPAERKLNANDSTNGMGVIQSPGRKEAVWSSTIGPEALKWLRRYGITDQEIQDYDFMYDGSGHWLILPLQRPAGSGTYQRRYFGSREGIPKYITTGPKAHNQLYGDNHGDGCAVMVEGIVDAIKVGRVAAAYPILGSDPSQEVIKRLLWRFKKVVVWLDPDMLLRASRAVLRASMTVGGARIARVSTRLDPKCYEVNKIKEILK